MRSVMTKYTSFIPPCNLGPYMAKDSKAVSSRTCALITCHLHVHCMSTDYFAIAKTAMVASSFHLYFCSSHHFHSVSFLSRVKVAPDTCSHYVCIYLKSMYQPSYHKRGYRLRLGNTIIFRRTFLTLKTWTQKSIFCNSNLTSLKYHQKALSASTTTITM